MAAFHGFKGLDFKALDILSDCRVHESSLQDPRPLRGCGVAVSASMVMARFVLVGYPGGYPDSPAPGAHRPGAAWKHIKS